MIRRLVRLGIRGIGLLFAVLCVVVVAGWVRGQFVQDQIIWAEVQREPHPAMDWFCFATYRESVQFRWDYRASKGPDRDRFDVGGQTHLRWNTHPPQSLPMPDLRVSTWNRLGFVLERFRDDDERQNLSRELRVAVPYWALGILAATIAAFCAFPRRP